MVRQYRRYARLIGILTWVVAGAFLAGCGETPMMIQRALGRDIAEARAKADEIPCPVITTFSVAPATAKCGGQVGLEIAATSPTGLPIRYVWEIEGQTFESGQKAVWNTPTTQTIGDPEKVYTVRGVASDGQCAVTRAVEVTVLCATAFDAMVHFEFAKAELDSTAKIALDEIGAKLQQNPNHAVLIEGHTDYVGTEPANEKLGERRAAAVKQYLQQQWNIDPSRVLTRSFGEVQPIAPNDSSAGRSKNRRAEVFRVMFSTVDKPAVMPLVK